jgi:hypothetical protein
MRMIRLVEVMTAAWLWWSPCMAPARPKPRKSVLQALRLESKKKAAMKIAGVVTQQIFKISRSPP